MPNHCHNRVTIYNAYDNEKSRKQIAKLKAIFEDEKVFGQIIPEPDWANTPLMSSDMPRYGGDTAKGNLGELPMQPSNENGHYVPFFQSTDRQDDRWYDWRLQNWDTKWDAYDVVVTDDAPDCLEVEFDTAWSPPEAICNEIREQYPDLAISWFYDEPGCEIAGYL